MAQKRRKLAQHALSHGSHAFTHTLTSTQLQPCGAKHQLSYYFSGHAGSFSVSVFHGTLTWNTGSLSCVRDHSCACAYTQGLGTPTASQHNICDSEKLTNFSCTPDGIRTSVLWVSSPTLYQLRHPRYWSAQSADVTNKSGPFNLMLHFTLSGFVFCQ